MSQVASQGFLAHHSEGCVQVKSFIQLWEQGWCGGESTHLPPMWIEFDSELGPYVG